MVETALVMPLYMLIVLGVLYFGYATLTRQRAVKAATFAVWMPTAQPADLLLMKLWPSGGGTPDNVRPVSGGQTAAAQGDLTLEASELSSQLDDYYRQEIPTQLTTGPLMGGGQPDTFDRERLAVSLWNYALGVTTQSFVWDAVKGITEVSNTEYGDKFSPAHYLNPLAGGVELGGGFVTADEATPPVIDNTTAWIASAFDGVGGTHWLERRHADLRATYSPPYFPSVFRATDEAPTTLGNYITGTYPNPTSRPQWEFTMDLTGHVTGNGTRLAAGEQGHTSAAVLGEAADLLGAVALPAVNDATQNLWKRW